MDKQAIIDMLFQLYRLRDEGKNVNATIAELEQKLCGLIEED